MIRASIISLVLFSAAALAEVVKQVDDNGSVTYTNLKGARGQPVDLEDNVIHGHSTDRDYLRFESAGRPRQTRKPQLTIRSKTICARVTSTLCRD